jgi:formamidopyrimidine-DNA glycosylase
MPELPEVETTLRGVAPHLVGQRVKEVIVRRWDLRWPIPREIEGIAGQRCESGVRRGKYLVFGFDSAGSVIVHLGMSGSLRVVPAETPWRKHDHFAFHLSEAAEVRLHDPRRFGAVLWVEGDPMAHELLKDLGPEPLTEAFSGSMLWQESRSKSVAIKNLIMDAKVVVGVGNIYACEALWMAEVSPLKASGKVSQAACEKLHAAIVEVLSASIEMGGTTLRDFLRDSGEPGYFKQSLRVYDREGEDCLRCSGKIRRVVLGQRSTFYCPKCQR